MDGKEGCRRSVDLTQKFASENTRPNQIVRVHNPRSPTMRCLVASECQLSYNIQPQRFRIAESFFVPQCSLYSSSSEMPEF